MSKVYCEGPSLADDIQNRKIPLEMIGLWNLGQAGVVMKAPPRKDPASSTIIAIDPYLTRSIEENNPETEFIREFDAPIPPEALKNVDAIFLTHHHDDHMDLQTLRRLHEVSPSTFFVVPAPHVGLMEQAGISREKIILAVAGERISINDLYVLPVASAHVAYERDTNDHDLYLGYVVNANGLKVYHSGDTIVTEELISTMVEVKPDVAILPINGGDYERTIRGIVANMSGREASDFAALIGVRLLIPNHYDMFPNNRDNPAHFVDYHFHHHRNVPFHMLAVGECLLYYNK